MSEIEKKSAAKSPRHRARELAVQGIYQWRLTGEDIDQLVKNTREEKSLGRYDTDLFAQLLIGAISQHEALIELISPHLDRSMNELSPVEFSILLLGTYELARQLEVPYRVVINESVELTKTFGGTDGHKYVNGVLDKLALKLRAVECGAGKA